MLALLRREKVHEMKPHAKNPPMGSTDVRPIGGLERGAENGAFSLKKSFSSKAVLYHATTE